MKILFQGDSITDVLRRGDDENYIGMGYPLLVKGVLGYEHPGEHTFFNRGVSGNRVVDVYARITKDILNLKPDVISILLGVNDVWHEVMTPPNGVDADKFFKVYSMLIEEILAELPETKIIILEPFVLKACNTEANWSYFETEVAKRAEMAKKVAEKYSLSFVPLQKGFDELAEKAPNDYWLLDGVHPSTMGHEFIKREWLKAFEAL